MERAEISEFVCPTMSSQQVELKSLMLHEPKLTGGGEKGTDWDFEYHSLTEKNTLRW